MFTLQYLVNKFKSLTSIISKSFWVSISLIAAVKNSNMSTLNCIEEVHLAEKLLDMHKWADKVKFARTGGEANALSVRIARASTSRQNIAFCGYHGWHDWYLSANLKKKDSLNSHLIKGLDPIGVSKKETKYSGLWLSRLA